jgi:hypothetical protein
MGWKYTPDRKGTGAYLKSSPGLRAELERRAHLGLAVGMSLAPFLTGALRSSGEVRFDGTNGGIKRDRMQFSIVFDVPHAAAATWPYGHDRTSYLDAAKAVVEAGN